MPVSDAVTLVTAASALLPLEAAVAQSDPSENSASRVPVAVAAQFAGAEPVRICSLADVPTALSSASSSALRAAVEN